MGWTRWSAIAGLVAGLVQVAGCKNRKHDLSRDASGSSDASKASGDSAADAPATSVDGPRDATRDVTFTIADGASAVIAPDHAARAIEIAATYRVWGRVDDELRWAPFLCRIPLPGTAYQSQSMDEDTHGRKLYSVFARDRANYPLGPHDGQAVVKESYLAERVSDPGARYEPHHAMFEPGAQDHFYPYAQHDGEIYRAAAAAGLYIMFKLPAGTPDTNAGWVYATITPEGVLTAAGRIESCMGCHVDAEHDRLFGVRTWH